MIFFFQYKKESEEIRLLYGGKYNYKVILDKIKEQAENSGISWNNLTLKTWIGTGIRQMMKMLLMTMK